MDSSKIKLEKPFTSDHSVDGPLRILVQTRTHLVPGSEYGEKLEQMSELICQHQWKRSFVFGKHQRRVEGDDFALYDRECWFLIDCGSSPDEEPPIAWYKWTGTEFITINTPLPDRVRSRLKRYPFHPSPPESKPAANRKRPNWDDPFFMRQHIYLKLRRMMMIFEEDLQFIRAHPQHAEWIKETVGSEIWAKEIGNRLEEEASDHGQLRFMWRGARHTS